MKKVVILLLLLVASSASAEIYTWKDNRGTAFYTNSLHEIPARYRSRARLLDVATGKKLPISAAESGGQSSSAPSGQPAAPQRPGGQQAPPTATNFGPSAPAAAYQGATTPPPASSKVTATTPSAQPPASSLPVQRQGRAERRAHLRQNRSANREE